MDIKVRIICQAYEIKAWYEGGEAWAPNGSHEFEISELDSDAFMYGGYEDLFNEFVKWQGSINEKFEIVDIVPVFCQTKKTLSEVKEFLTKVKNPVISEAGVLI